MTGRERRRRREPSRRAGWLIAAGFVLGLLVVIGLQLADAPGAAQPVPAVTRVRVSVVPGPTVTITPGPQYTITFTPAAGNG